MPKLADLFVARYRADWIDFDSIRVHHGDVAGGAADGTVQLAVSGRGRDRRYNARQNHPVHLGTPPVSQLEDDN